MRLPFRIFLNAIILITILVALLEICAQLIPHPPLQESLSSFLKQTRADDRPDSKIQKDIFDTDFQFTNLNRNPKTPHPYLGYVMNRAFSTEVNRDGFLEKKGFNDEKTPSEYVIGIWGGSVAMLFAEYEKQKMQSGKKWLGSLLKEKYPEKFKNKNISLLNFGMSSYAQPQSFFAYTLYFKNIDMAINIDGANEARRPITNSFPSIFPTYSPILFSIDPERQLYWLGILRWRNQQLRLAKFINRYQLLTKSHLVYFLWFTYLSYSDSKMAQLATGVEETLDSRHPYYTSKWNSPDQLIDEPAKIWEKYTRLTITLQRSHKIKGYFFIHPNQYLPRTKVLSQEELERFYRVDNHTENFILTYKSLINMAHQLAREGLPVYDLTTIYQNNKSTLYRDRCCHPNNEGLEILEAEIFSRITK